VQSDPEQTLDKARAIWLADRAGLKPSPERLAWIAACIEALQKARDEGAVEAHRLWQSGALPAETAK
jgi:hypothetical protein